MAVPDPYKYANKSTNKVSPSIPKSGVIPTPTTTSPTPYPLPKAGNIPSPGLSNAATPITPSYGIPKSTGTVPTPPASTKSTFSTPEYTDWQAKTNEQFSNLEKLMSQQFSYDPENDPAYQAQRQLAQLRAGDATKNAMEAANEKGIFGSSVMTSQLGQIQQRAEQEAAAYIPEYRQQAYGQFQDRLANAGAMLNNARNLRGDEFNEGIAEGQLTGNYMPRGADQLVSQILALKGQAETQGITAEERSVLSKQADGLRAQLQAMGVDPSALGANVNRANAATANIGTRTLAGQAQDYGQQADVRDYDRGVLESDRAYQFQTAQQEWENNFQSEQFDWQKAQQAWENAFQEKNFQQSMKEAAASRGLQWASLGQRNKEFVAEMAFKKKQFEYEQEQDKKSNEIAALKASNNTSNPTKSEIEAEYYANPLLDKMNQAQLENFFSTEKKNIISDLGVEGFEKLRKAYVIY